MDSFARIKSDPRVMRGQACITGTRVTVTSIIGMLATGHSRERILEAFPELKPEDVDEALKYAAWRMSEQQASAG